LSLDGGGIRGAFGTALIARYEEKLGGPISDQFDLIAGTSTGAIIAASLANGMPAQKIVDFYNERGPQIFTPREPHTPMGWVKWFYPAARRIVNKRFGVNFDDFFRARFCPHVLNDSFVAGFGDLTIGEVRGARLIVPTVDLSNGQTHVFRTPHLPEQTTDTDVKIKDILIAATAAPTYFPHKTMPDGNSYADGGLYAVNPAMLAFAEAMKIRQFCKRETCDPRYDTGDIEIISIGTGVSKFSLEPPGSDAGQLFWASHVADVMGHSQTHGLEAPLQFVLGNRYKRINFELPDATWKLDAIEYIPRLFEIGREVADQTYDDLASACFGEPSADYVPFE
jgi:patatin-like phospholipase/acyl hydrolase